MLQRRMVLSQHTELARQVRALVGILERQIRLAGKDPLAAEEEPQQQQQEVLAHVSAVQAQPPKTEGDQQADTQCQSPWGVVVTVQNEPVVKAAVSRGICQGPSYMPVLVSMVLAWAELSVISCSRVGRGNSKARGNASTCICHASLCQQAWEADAGSRGQAAHPL